MFDCPYGHLQSRRNVVSDGLEAEHSWLSVAYEDVNKPFSYLLLDREGLPERCHTANDDSDRGLSASLALVFNRQSLPNYHVIT